MNDSHLLSAKGPHGLTGSITPDMQTPESLLTPLSSDSTSTQSLNLRALLWFPHQRSPTCSTPQPLFSASLAS